MANADSRYREYTTQASTVARSLALSAIAVVWLFAGGLAGKDATPEQLLANVRSATALDVALRFALLALLLDLLQYVWAAAAWGRFHREIEGVVRGDNGTTAFKEVRDAWVRAKKIGFVAQLERAAAMDPPADEEARLLQARRLIHPQNGEMLPGVADMLASTKAPPTITRVTALLLWTKLLSLAICFVSLGAFLS